VVSQTADSVYTANGIDGSTVTEFSFTGATIKIFVSDPDNATTGQRMYNWYMYALATTTYIDLQPNDMTAQTPWSYVLADAIQLYNQSATPLFMTGANINNVSSTGQVIDTAGGIININGSFPFNSAADVAAANWERALEGTYTAEEIMRGLSAVLMGRSAGGPSTPVFRDINNTKTRVSGTAVAGGNRTNVTLDLS
jgi:hypothetical protein